MKSHLQRETEEVYVRGWQSNLDDSKSPHTKIISSFPFVQSIQAILPTSDIKVQKSLCEIKQFPFSVGLVQLSDLVIQGVPKGVGYVSLSSRLDADDCVCITPAQQLYMLLTKDTHETLGLTGKRLNSERQRWMVQIDLANPMMQSQSQSRAFSSLVNALRKLPPFVMTCSHPELKQQKVMTYSKRAIPNLSVPQSVLDQQDMMGVLDWTGAVLANIVPVPKHESELAGGGFISEYLFDQKQSAVMDCQIMSWKGMCRSEMMCEMLNKIANLQLPWAIVVLRGFRECPVAWNGARQTKSVANGEELCCLLIGDEKKYRGMVVSANHHSLPL